MPSFYLHRKDDGSWGQSTVPLEDGRNEYSVEVVGGPSFAQVTKVAATQWFHAHGEMALVGTDLNFIEMAEILEAVTKVAEVRFK